MNATATKLRGESSANPPGVKMLGIVPDMLLELLLTIWLCPSQGMLKCVSPVGISRSSEAGAIPSLPVLACVQLR
jgi:hypothetical protein